LQCSQAKAAKAIIANELQTYATISNRITINLLRNFNNKKTNNLLALKKQFEISLIPYK